MKSLKRMYLERVLRLLAKVVLWKYKPIIVGITGSIGKTSTKEAVFDVLASKFRVRKNEKNYNNEVGLPLTIIGAESGNQSIFRWLVVVVKWLVVVVFPVRYPDILVLEMGVDRPGDMDYLLSFIKPTVGIMTSVSEAHLEFFKSVDHIAREKSKLVKNLLQDGCAILNADDERLVNIGEKLKMSHVFFGFGEKADIKASDAVLSVDNFEPQGISFKLNYEGKIIPIRLPSILAPHLAYAALAAVATGIYFKINLVDISKALETFTAPASRMSLIEGLRGSFIIDDSYNSAPVSFKAAIDAMKNIKAIRKIVALGDMLELGGDSNEKHHEALTYAAQHGAQLFFVVGERMKRAAGELEMKGMLSGKVLYFDDPEYLGMELKKGIREGDLVLVKGSQGMRMEKVVKEIMAYPAEAEKLLCRQSKEWVKKPFVKP